MSDYNTDEDEKDDLNRESSRRQADDNLKEKLDQMNPQKIQRDSFLDAISQIESSGGKNMNHPVVQQGIQAGDQAVGKYGLMPNTMQELISRQGRNPASVNTADPVVQQQLANQLADKVLNKFQDPAMAAYSWNKGHNLSPDEVRQRGYENDPYVQKFKNIWQRLGYK